MEVRFRAWIPALGLALAVSGPAGADPVSDAETLVRAVWYEGLPAEAARDLSGPAIARLVEMLADPQEAPHHANIALALGYSGHRDAYPALAALLATPLAGEVDRDAFRTQTTTRLAMGQLARRDPRALRWLLDAEQRGAAAPAWHFRHHRGVALATLLEEQVLSALAISGAPAARVRLDDAVAEARAATGPAESRRLRFAEAARARLGAEAP